MTDCGFLYKYEYHYLVPESLTDYCPCKWYKERDLKPQGPNDTRHLSDDRYKTSVTTL